MRGQPREQLALVDLAADRRVGPQRVVVRPTSSQPHGAESRLRRCAGTPTRSPAARSARRIRERSSAGAVHRAPRVRAAARRQPGASSRGTACRSAAGRSRPALHRHGPLTLVPKLLGIYERELHAAIEAAIRAAPRGSSTSARPTATTPSALRGAARTRRVVAYEADAGQRELLGRSSAATASRCRSWRRRPEALSGADLVVMDCEGCERALLIRRSTRRSSSSCTTCGIPASARSSPSGSPPATTSSSSRAVRNCPAGSSRSSGRDRCRGRL